MNDAWVPSRAIACGTAPLLPLPASGERERRVASLDAIALGSQRTPTRLLLQSDGATGAEDAVGPRLQVRIDVVHIGSNVGIVGEALHD